MIDEKILTNKKIAGSKADYKQPIGSNQSDIADLQNAPLQQWVKLVKDQKADKSVRVAKRNKII